MTKINKLVLQGFKSFAKKTELLLGPKFNCILGPNGSGKSNVLDALCFVLGKTSSKSLRAEKSANLIYNGGKTKNPAKQANVTIHFDNENNSFPVKAKEIVISRTVRESGSSTYRINDKKCTRNEIVELLSTAKINPDGYNIILQGDITQLIEMSPNERREIIEEIAGIGIYEEKKRKALNELNKVEENLKEADIVLAERESYLRELKKERNQALKFKELDDKIKQNKATILNIKIKSKEQQKANYESQMDKIKDEIKKDCDKISEIKNQIEEKKQLIKDINKEIEEKGDKDQVKIQKEVEQLRVDIATSKTRIGGCENELSRITQRKDQLLSSVEELKERISRLELEKQTLENNIKEKQDLIKKIDVKINSFKTKHKIDDSNNIEKEIEEIDKTADKKQADIQELREKQQNLLREKDRIEYQAQTADEKIEKVLAVEKESQEELVKLKQLKQEFKKATLELNQRLNEDSSLAAQLGNARSRLLKLNEELAKLNARKLGIKEKLEVNIAIKKILELKNKLKGIFGTISDLGEVSSKYSTALGVAAGSKIKSIVVDNDKTAADCINYLKNNRLGVATFLPLNKIKGAYLDNDLKAISKANGVHGFAIDLIKFEPRFRNVFSYAFANTLVVDNIDTARRIGIGKARMVTLEGDITEISGAMQGGFRRKNIASGFQEKELSKEMDNFEQQLNDIKKIISTLEKKKQENEDSIARLRELKVNLEADIIKSEKSLHLESDDLEVSKKLKKELFGKLQEIEKDLVNIQKEISICNKELADAKIKKQALREKISALKSPTLIAELNTFEQKKTELKEDIFKAQADIKNIEVQVSTILSPELTNTNKILKQHEKEFGSFEEEIKSLSANIKIQEKELKEKEASQKEFYTKFKALFKKRDSINEEISKSENILYKKEESRRASEQKKNNVSLDHARVSAEVAGLQEEYKEFEGVPLFKGKDEETIKREIWQFEKMRQDIGAVNMRALEIYEKVKKEYDEIIDKKQKLAKEREDVLLMINEIESKKKDLFMKTFDSLTEHFKAIFSQLSTKGEAFLQLEDPETVFEGGLLIKVKLTGRKFLDIRSLSGGEKTMTALAFLFAVQEYDPASFYILDEVDAALDKRNSERLADLVRRYTHKAQYIIISHNDGVISEADNLYGVSMDQHGMSKVVSLRI
ncbi:chromosome segregation protein SMC [Candidatus Woesearchaeota archaeon]|nr:chromosome segregation protein SMC [Candidatus Woesearchaeota archaeon]